MKQILSLGPFQGITDYIFRNLFLEYFGGIDKLYTPFFTAVHKSNAKNLQGAELDPKLNDTKLLIPQLLSNDSAELIRFATYCATKGYQEVNLNMGCPFSRVAQKKRGSGMLPYPEMIESMLSGYFDHQPLNLSVKCRLGYRDDSDIEKLIPVFNKFPLSEVIIHSRTGIQLYRGISDQDAFARIKGKLSHMPAYNGDIFSVDDYHNILDFLPDVAHLMLGRGLLADPFLASDIKGMIVRDKSVVLYHFLTTLFKARMSIAKDPHTAIGRMKELWNYLRWSFDDPVNIWRIIRRVSSPEDYVLQVQEIFGKHEWKGSGYRFKALQE